VEQQAPVELRKTEVVSAALAAGSLKTSRMGEDPMRFIVVVLAGVLLGLSIGFFNMTRSEAEAAHDKVVSERMTWIWTPAVPRRSSVQ
jgi:hypothetical protein